HRPEQQEPGRRAGERGRHPPPAGPRRDVVDGHPAERQEHHLRPGAEPPPGQGVAQLVDQDRHEPAGHPDHQPGRPEDRVAEGEVPEQGHDQPEPRADPDREPEQPQPQVERGGLVVEHRRPPGEKSAAACPGGSRAAGPGASYVWPARRAPGVPMDWTAFRARFPVARRWAFLDHAAVAPIPDRAVEALEEYGRRPAENGIADVWFWSDRVAHVRRLAAQLVNAPSPDDVCFVPNTTAGIGLVAEGFPWKPGDNVVLAAEEYPSNQYPWLNLADRGVEVRPVPSRGGRVEIDDVRAAMDGRTRVLTASFVQFASGFRADLDALGSLCRERGVLFFVDAIQGLGVFPLDVSRTPIDFLAADGHT